MFESLRVIITFILVLIVFIIYNILKKYRNLTRKNGSLLEELLRQRCYLALNLIEIVKKCPDLELAKLGKIDVLKTKNYDKLELNKKIEIDKKISKIVSKIVEIVDKNSDLKNNEQYIAINKQLIQLDNDITKNKKEYKRLAKEYNSKIEGFPNNLVAILFGFNEEKIENSKKK